MSLRTSAALASVVCCGLLACQRDKPQPGAPASAAATTSAYPTRPNVSPPAVKLFHKTDTSLTLVTDPNATDQQIEALVWQIRDTAHAHSLATLGPSFAQAQAFVDSNKPSTWFHIYRGARCASEKYATGSLPCGASYHAAADYTLGTPGNPIWDNGILLTAKPGSDDPIETPLWDADAPYTPKP